MDHGDSNVNDTPSLGGVHEVKLEALLHDSAEGRRAGSGRPGLSESTTRR